LESNRIENREYQNYIIDRILTSVNNNRNVILELDCGMGKRVIIYRLIAEAFLKEKILIFLQNQSSLQETEDYLNNRYGGIEDLGVVHSKHSSIQRKYILENSRIILTLPLSFMNTIKKYPNIASSFNIIIINEIDTIIRRISYNTVLRNPWNHIISRFSHCRFIGMSGTLRDYHTISSDKKVFKRKELSTLLDFFPNTDIIYLEDLNKTDINNYITHTEIYLHPVNDDSIKEIIDFLSLEIKKIKDNIKKDHSSELQNDEMFLNDLQFLDIEPEIIKKLNHLLILRKYVYSMPVSSFWKHLLRFGFSPEQLPPYPQKTGKENYTIKVAQRFKKVVILCSYLSSIYSLKKQFLSIGYNVYVLEGKTTIKAEPLTNFKNAKEKSVLLISSVGERDLDIPQTDVLIVYDLVNSPKTVYQKMKRSRRGKVFILFYNNTSEQNKVRRVISEIVVKYPWSIIYYGEKNVNS